MCPPVLPKPGSKDDEELVGLISMISKSTRENLDQGRYEEGFRLWGGCNGKEIKKVGVSLNSAEDCEVVGFLSGNLGSHCRSGGGIVCYQTNQTDLIARL